MSTEMKEDEMELAISMLEEMKLSLDRYIEKHFGRDEEERRRRIQELRDREHSPTATPPASMPWPPQGPPRR